MKTNLSDVKDFKEIRTCGRKVLIADERILNIYSQDHNCNNLYAYDIRHDDAGDLVTIEPYNGVSVNFGGTLITHKPIALRANNYIVIELDFVFNFLNDLENIDPIDYMNKLHEEDNHQEEVFKFIEDFIMQSEANGISSDNLRNIFMAGYCYHFAHMLKAAFNRGEVYICAPYGHVVWRDEDNRYYDFDGEYVNHSATYIPVSDPESHWQDFAHNGIEHAGATEEDIHNLITKYMHRFPNM